MSSKLQQFVQTGLVLTPFLCLGTLALAPQAEAALTMNGFTINGLTFNGVWLDGTSLNADTPTLHRETSSASTPHLHLQGSQLILHR